MSLLYIYISNFRQKVNSHMISMEQFEWQMVLQVCMNKEVQEAFLFQQANMNSHTEVSTLDAYLKIAITKQCTAIRSLWQDTNGLISEVGVSYLIMKDLEIMFRPKKS